MKLFLTLSLFLCCFFFCCGSKTSDKHNSTYSHPTSHKKNYPVGWNLYVVAENDEEAATIAEENEREEAPWIESIAECRTLKDVELERHYALPYTGDNIDDGQSDYTVKDWISKIVKCRKKVKT